MPQLFAIQSTFQSTQECLVLFQSFCRFKFYMDKEYEQTPEIAGTINPQFNHEKRVNVKTVTEQFVDYLNNESMYIEVWGRQKQGKFQREKTMVSVEYLQ